jgi:hypothetical protein
MKTYILIASIGINLAIATSSAFADALPDSYPIWANVREIPRQNWLKKEESQSLSNWCSGMERLLSQKLPIEKVKGTQCTFLVSGRGYIRDPFIWWGRNETNEKFVINRLNNFGPLPSPPASLGDRRLLVIFKNNGPEVCVDFNQHEGLPDRQNLFDEIRKKHM